jgi:hypothetical protein
LPQMSSDLKGTVYRIRLADASPPYQNRER